MVQSVNQGSGTASFRGILLKRERLADHNLVQLLFRKDDQNNVLCVSTNPKDATWEVGQTYKVDGTFAERAGRKFVQNPHIALIKSRWPSVRRFAIIAAILALLAGGGAYLAMRLEHYSFPSADPLPAHVKQTSKTSATDTSATAAPAADSTTTTPAASTVDPCQSQVLAFTPRYVYDASAAGTVLQQGQNGSEDVCSDGTTSNVVLPVAEIISSGPAAPASAPADSTDGGSN